MHVRKTRRKEKEEKEEKGESISLSRHRATARTNDANCRQNSSVRPSSVLRGRSALLLRMRSADPLVFPIHGFDQNYVQVVAAISMNMKAGYDRISFLQYACET